jgi:triosephosphate isomerase
MNKSRIPVIAGNWKMYKNADEALNFIYNVNSAIPSNKIVETVICAPSLFLHALVKRKGSELKIGAQNSHYLKEGAYTGEISPAQISDTGVDYCLVGHSERRQYQGETDKDVNLKIKALLDYEITPIFCLGESLEIRKSGKFFNHLESQLKKGLDTIPKFDLKRIIIAYEPIWAIGTGEVATTTEIEETCGFIRKTITKLYDDKTSKEVRILYGGSVKPSNIKEILECNNVDGALVGGASLIAESYVSLVKSAKEIIDKINN